MNISRLARLNIYSVSNKNYLRYLSTECSHIKARVLETAMKKPIEEHWRGKLSHKRFDPTNTKEKMYILSMFPYPSGNLHMGHVRVYTISDAIANFHRLRGKNVFHPMGWDAFGLPAENAAIQRKIPADVWTKENISRMRERLEELGCSFDWQAELATCDPSYYKWTQKLFLMLFNDGLAYQREATVNWDPVDKTVLADEQVDSGGRSWRSGAKIEKKLLKQWYIRTTKFSEQLFSGLDDPSLQDWRDIIKLQKHWIGEVDGWNFELKVGDHTITIWSKSPEDFIYAGFVAIKKEHFLNKERIDNGLLPMMVKNPFGKDLPLLVTNEVEFPPFNETYVGVPTRKDCDLEIAQKYDIKVESLPLEDNEEDRNWVLEKAQHLGIGGSYKVSSKLRDWLISRQRYWGTPIPIIHCDSCGVVPVKYEDLPVELPKMNDESIGQPLHQNTEWLECLCPKCGSKAQRESDTMDTFVDSSWYFLRYLDPNNKNDLVDKSLAQSMMPVDIYIGGKEHAVLHLYYARFINHFLHEKGYVLDREPFKRLLVQGMVMGKSYQVKETGQYINENEVEIVGKGKKSEAKEKSSGKAVTVMWEKMSKSKLNGVDPVDVLNVHGCDTTRLIMLADVAPTSHRNWSEATFPGVINWQRRLWLTVYDFILARSDIENVVKSPEFDEHEFKLLDAVNYFTSGVTFNFLYSHQISVGISKMQGLTNSIRRAPKDVIVFGKNYERCLAAQIIMLAPLAPHFASELWATFTSAENRINKSADFIKWNENVLSQHWPKVDPIHKVELTIKVNNYVVSTLMVECGELRKMSGDEAFSKALNQEVIKRYIEDRKILGSTWEVFEDYEGVITLFVETRQKQETDESDLLKDNLNA
ncbi:CLUMA_CG012473, isoform A [Clunio marinus]|uniref:leucine--tRNA ligase n=1 Tax=Clunio marinus TaxID=568069 RepID=A0A1J1IHD3_9DIPT|nr:CLUMA_CG012473, isoform A [Clunio marinus]